MGLLKKYTELLDRNTQIFARHRNYRKDKQNNWEKIHETTEKVDGTTRNIHGINGMILVTTSNIHGKQNY